MNHKVNKTNEHYLQFNILDTKMFFHEFHEFTAHNKEYQVRPSATTMKLVSEVPQSQEKPASLYKTPLLSRIISAKLNIYTQFDFSSAVIQRTKWHKNMKISWVFTVNVSVLSTVAFDFPEEKNPACKSSQDCLSASDCPAVVKDFKERNIQPTICK